MICGVVTTNGYLTVDSAHNREEWSSVSGLRQAINEGRELLGDFGLPGVPGHPRAMVLIDPAHVVAIVEKPE